MYGNGMEPLAMTHLLEFARARGMQADIDSDWVAGSLMGNAYDFAAFGLLKAMGDRGIRAPEWLVAELREAFPDEDDIMELLSAEYVVA